MSQNKFMHPRNIYRKPPSFKELAIQYPEFRKFAKQDLSGKISIDFKDQGALRALTCCLLEKDFGLTVDIPLNRLVPTLPLRLNYLLWLEDLVNVGGIRTEGSSRVNGIDIGAGASCIYPLLAAKKNGWHMTATEVDEESVAIAKKNVNTNNLQDFIKVKHVEVNTLLLKSAVEPGFQYAFSMCNPPFFSSEQDLDYVSKSRSVQRPPPHNASTGDTKELIAPGGEVAFIGKIMDESEELKDVVKIFTTMVGHKSSLSELKSKLNALDVKNIAETRFCQGNTTRWGLAWTFENDLNLNTAVQIPSKKKGNSPMTYVIPEGVGEIPYSLEGVTQHIIEVLEQLQIKCKQINQNKNLKVFEIIAFTNTWSHQRRKRRMVSSTMTSSPGDAVEDVSTSERDVEESPEKIAKGAELAGQKEREDAGGNTEEPAAKRVQPESDNSAKGEISHSLPAVDKDKKKLSQQDAQNEKAEHSPCSSQKLYKGLSDPVLEATLLVRSGQPQICLEFLWGGGLGGKDAMHQVLQFIKNKLR